MTDLQDLRRVLAHVGDPVPLEQIRLRARRRTRVRRGAVAVGLVAAAGLAVAVAPPGDDPAPVALAPAAEPLTLAGLEDAVEEALGLELDDVSTSADDTSPLGLTGTHDGLTVAFSVLAQGVSPACGTGILFQPGSCTSHVQPDLSVVTLAEAADPASGRRSSQAFVRRPDGALLELTATNQDAASRVVAAAPGVPLGALERGVLALSSRYRAP